MKKWPEVGTVPFDELVDPLRKLVNKLYSLKAKSPEIIEYKGYGLDKMLSHSSLQPQDLLNSLDKQQEQNRDPMTILISIAVQLGIEQGARMANERREPLEKLRQDIERMLKRLESKH